MISFSQFLTEAESVAAQQAKQLGLQSAGYGNWRDPKTGQVTHRTVNGSLKPVAADEAPQQKEPKQEKPAPEEKQEKEPVRPKEVEKTKGTLTIAFGRFNPPTTGHEKLLNQVADSSDDGDYMIIPSRSVDKKKNPLDTDTKVDIMKQMYPDHADKIVNNASNRTIFDVMRQAHNDGYANIRIVGGGDRVKEYENLANRYNGSTYQFDEIEVINAGDRDPDAEGTEGMSASKMRKAAAENDFRAFRQGVPSTMSNKDAMKIFTQVQQSMGIEPQKETAEDWEIAPRLDLKNLRENYIADKIFNIGDTITHDSTGLTASIVRKGTNYLICVTENEKMFKTWTYDVTPADLKGAPAQSTPKEREVGTDSLRSFLQRLTPGQREGSFINKNN